MYRTGGLITLIVAGLLAYFWGFTPFHEDLPRLTRTDDGGWERVTLECPDPWSVLIEEERPVAQYRGEGEECVRPARTLFTGAVFAAIAGLAFGIGGIARGARPDPVRIRSISQLLQAGRRHRGGG